MTTRVLKTADPAQVAQAAQQAARTLDAGGLVGFPTETVYGVAARADRADAYARLAELKSHPRQPFTIHLPAPGEARRYVRDIPAPAGRVIAKGWPGPVTLLLPVGGKLADSALQEDLYDRLCRDDMIALRCPDEPAAQAMLAAAAGPVVAAGASLGAGAAARSGEELLSALDGRVELLLDGGATRWGRDSTVVRFDGGSWQVVREGAVPARQVARLARRVLLFVCTGNTCRSPMAAALAKVELARKLGCRVGELTSRGYEVLSAGIAAANGMPATPEAERAVRARGANLASHRSRMLTAELINAADVIFCMTGFHVDAVRRMAPHAAERIVALGGDQDVRDPVGGGDEVYQRTAEAIARLVATRLEKEGS